MRKKYKFLLTLIAIVLAFLIAEIYLRVVLKESPFPQLTQQSSTFGFEHVPNVKAKYESREYSSDILINSHGLRGDEIAYKKQPDIIRIALIGDSFVEGFQVDEPATVRARLEDVLNNNSDVNFEVNDFSVGGYGIDQKYLTIKEKIVNYDPDLIILFFASNDLDDLKRNNIVNMDQNRLYFNKFKIDSAPLKTLKSFLKKSYFINYLYKRIPTNTLYGVDKAEIPIQHKLYMGQLSSADKIYLEITERLIANAKSISEENGAKFLLILGADKTQVELDQQENLKQHYKRDKLFPAYINNDLENFLTENKIDYVDLLPHMASVNKTEKVFYDVDGHWNEVGHRHVSSFISGTILKILGKDS